MWNVWRHAKSMRNLSFIYVLIAISAHLKFNRPLMEDLNTVAVPTCYTFFV